MSCNPNNTHTKVKAEETLVQNTYNALQPCSGVCRHDIEIVGAGILRTQPSGTPETFPRRDFGFNDDNYGKEAQWRVRFHGNGDRTLVWMAERFADLGQHLEETTECGIVAYQNNTTVNGWTDSITAYGREFNTGVDSRIQWEVSAEDLKIPAGVVRTEYLPNQSSNCEANLISRESTESLELFVSRVGKSINGLVPVYGWSKAEQLVEFGGTDPIDDPYRYFALGFAWTRFINLNTGNVDSRFIVHSFGYAFGNFVYRDLSCNGEVEGEEPFYYNRWWGRGFWTSWRNNYRTSSQAIATLGNTVALTGASHSVVVPKTHYATLGPVVGCTSYTLDETSGDFVCNYKGTNSNGARTQETVDGFCFRFGDKPGTQNFYAPLGDGSGKVFLAEARPSTIDNPNFLTDTEGDKVEVNEGFWQHVCGKIYGLRTKPPNDVLETFRLSRGISGLGISDYIFRYDPETKQPAWLLSPPGMNLITLGWAREPDGNYIISTEQDWYVVGDYSPGGIHPDDVAECLPQCTERDPIDDGGACCEDDVPSVQIFAGVTCAISRDGESIVPDGVCVSPFQGGLVPITVTAEAFGPFSCDDDCITSLTIGLSDGDAQPALPGAGVISPCFGPEVTVDECEYRRVSACFLVDPEKIFFGGGVSAGAKATTLKGCSNTVGIQITAI